MTTAPSRDLDDVSALRENDPDGMLQAIASSAAQVREAAVLTAEAGIERLAEAGRPRSIVVCGMGGSGIAGDVLTAVAGSKSPVPVITHRGYDLPAWVGAGDAVMAVSCSGSTEETLAALSEAVRRGAATLVVGAEGSPAHDLAQQGRTVFVPVPQGRQPRASVWALSTPLVLAGHALGMLEAPAGTVEDVAAALEQVAEACRPDADEIVNPAKSLATELVGALPVVWGSSPLTGVAAYRFACQINENANSPAVWGVLPEANHNQVVAFDGPQGGGAAGPAGDDLFRDRAEDVEQPRLSLVLLRDADEHPQTARRADVSARLATERGLPVHTLRAEGESAFERLARVVCLTDFVSAYLALAQGLDPTPVDVITTLKQAIAR